MNPFWKEQIEEVKKKSAYAETSLHFGFPNFPSGNFA